MSFSPPESCILRFVHRLHLTGLELTSRRKRCLKDLRERFAKVDIQASKPIVPFRETAVKAAGKPLPGPSFSYQARAKEYRLEMAPPKHSSKRGQVNGSSTRSLVKFSIRVAPLPKSLLDFILDNIPILKRLQRERRNASGGSTEDEDQGKEDDDADLERSYDGSGETVRKPTVRPEQFWTGLEEVCKKAGGDWDKGIVDRIWAFGPHRAGGCLLIDARKNIGTSNSYALLSLPFIRSEPSCLQGYGGSWIEPKRPMLRWRRRRSARMVLQKMGRVTISTTTSRLDSN